MYTKAARSPSARLTRYLTAGLVGLGCVATTPGALAKADDDADAASFEQVEHKVKGLKKRVQQLEAEVAALQSIHYPVEVAVDCGAGQSVADALTAHAEGKGLLTIRVSGTCAEAITISRSNVVLQGQGPTTLFQPTGITFVIAIVDNTSNVTVQDLAVNGSTSATAGIVANKGAHVVVRNVTVYQSGSGVMALDSGVLDVTGSTLRNNGQGAYAARGGVVSISNSIIENNNSGALAWKAGTVIFTSSAPDMSASTGPIIRNNNNGAVVRSGGFLDLSDTTIENNLAYGILADTGGSVHFFSRLYAGSPGNRVVNNPVAGVLMNKNASVVFQDLTNVITANGRGIWCINNPAYLAPVGFTVTGNTAGDIVGCTP